VDTLRRLGGQRQQPGLRREEVAMLAGLSPAYYARLEEGQEPHPPDRVLHALARVFELDAAAAEHMFRLAHPTGPVRISQQVLQTVENWYRAPVLAVNHQLDVLAANSMARTLFKGMDHTDNLMRHAFLAPAAQEFFPNWEQEARCKVAHLRAAAGPDHSDPALAELVEELATESKDFRRMWSAPDAHVDEYKHLHHQEVGGMTLRHDTLSVRSAPGVLLYVCHAEPGTPAEEALALLSILAADEP
jgi:transcriptional regulator with XRE-family HTH domain